MSLGDGSSGQLKLPCDLYDLESELKLAVKLEDYGKAAKVRDELKKAREGDEVAKLLLELGESVNKQDFDKASAIKQKLSDAVSSRSLGVMEKRRSARVNRLLVMTREGKLLTCRPDGGSIVPVGNSMDKAQFLQPTWSPGGDLIVAAKIEIPPDGKPLKIKESVIEIFWALDGTKLVEVSAPFIPFYYFWLPDSRGLVYLTTYADGPAQAGWQVSMDILRVFAGDERGLLPSGSIMHLEEGAPLFVCPSPRDKRILMHIGNKQKVAVIEPLSLDGQEVILSSRPGAFRCPQWFPIKGENGEELVAFVERSNTGDSQFVVVADANKGESKKARRVLTEIEGFATITVSPDGQRMALLARLKRNLAETLSIMDGPFELSEDPWPVGSTILSSDDREEKIGPRRRVLAFFWSPDSRKLLWLSAPEKDDILAASGGQAEIFWEVYDTLTGRSVRFEHHMPSQTVLASYLPFFDQYALSHAVWSPDSDAFCYAGVGMDGAAGAWVQELPSSFAESPPPPRLVISGAETVSWSQC